MTNNWPTDKTGYPVDADKNGAHLLRDGLGVDIVALWDEDQELWLFIGTLFQKPSIVAEYLSYIGPCTPPSGVKESLTTPDCLQVDDLRAKCLALADEMDAEEIERRETAIRATQDSLKIHHNGKADTLKQYSAALRAVLAQAEGGK